MGVPHLRLRSEQERAALITLQRAHLGMARALLLYDERCRRREAAVRQCDLMGITDTEMAKYLGCSKQAISNVLDRARKREAANV